MQRIARLSPLLVVVFVFALALPQFAFAQRLKPIPHPIGVMTHPTAEAQAQAASRGTRPGKERQFFKDAFLAMDSAYEPAEFSPRWRVSSNSSH